MKARTVLSDNGREYCGREDRHLYEVFLQLEDSLVVVPGDMIV